MKTFKTMATKTRKEARTLVSTLKAQGLKPSTPTKKTGAGWLVATHKTIKRSIKQRYRVIDSQAVLIN
jgi:hypothetical protein